MTRPLILDLLPDFHGATITDVTYWGTGEAERFKSATRDDDGVWSAPARRARLAVLDERIARLEGRLSRPDTTDMAAYGGAVNTRIQARREAAMVRDVETGAELHRLTREAEGLRSLLGVTA